MKISRLSSMLVVLALAAVSPAQAELAKMPGTISAAGEREQFSWIFLGFVESVGDTLVRWPAPGDRERYRGQKAHVRMLSIWKGSPKRELDVVSVSAGCARGSQIATLEEGVSYLFYADRVGAEARYASCNRTRPVAQAAEDLAELGTPAIVQRLPGRKSHRSH
jgi:hypothetical protein